MSCFIHFSITLTKRLQPGLRASQNQGVNIVGAFVGVDGFQVGHVADDMVFIGDAVGAVHVARHSGDFQGFAAVVALYQRDVFRRAAVFVQQLADAQAGLQA